jgi:tetratricopeptide (TPR) repeat protein
MTSQFDKNEVLSLCNSIADTSRIANDRLEAAASCSWIIKRTDLRAGVATLCRAVISRFVDDLKDSARSTSLYTDLNYWRHFDLADLTDALDHGKIDVRTAQTCASLLFDAARHVDAVPFFERALRLSPSPELVILGCYNIEVIARQQGNLAMVERAIALITVDFEKLLAAPQFAAEVDHLHGHLLLLKGRLQKTRTLGLERVGTQYLARAAGADPSYFGCYASSFAEHGDFLGSIDACLDILRHEPLGDLSARDKNLVRLELLFYLAYSLMSIGELSRAERCFDAFAKATEGLGLLEARDHARLFLVKLGLRRTPLVDIDDTTLANAFAELRALSFREALSIPVEAECQRYEEVVSFLRAAAEARRQPSSEASRKLGQGATVLLSNLMTHRPQVLDGLSLAVGPKDLFPEMVESAHKAIRQRMSMIPDLGITILTSTEPPVASRAEGQFAFVLWFGNVAKVDTGPTLALNVIPVGSDSDASGLPNLDTALDLLVVGVAMIAIKRFWTQDHYVFGIVPCVESPATKFQRTKYSLLDVL